jgi:arylsulfatase A-like enzyme
MFILALAACAHQNPPPGPLPEGHEASLEVVAPADAAWTASSFEVEAGETLELWGSGEARIAGWSWNGRSEPSEVGPRGTYLYPNDEAGQEFPLAAGRSGPAPPFSLLARIGEDGPPLLVGDHRALRADRSGEVFLGINDFDVADNTGAFRVGLRRGAADEALAPESPDVRSVVEAAGEPRPVEDPRVLIIFIDGLRYDALKEMAFAGYLPNIRRLFFEGGVDVEQTTTIFPSNTLPATTAMLTGSWPDRTGISTQMLFDRERGRLSYMLSPFSPAELGRRFEPGWWQLRTREPGMPKILARWVEDAGGRFAATVLPLHTAYPPDLFFHRLANVTPLFGAHLQNDYYIDRAQTAFAVERVISSDHRVMMIWYTGVDTAGHRSPRGVWGEGRRDLVQIDADLARLEEALVRQGIADQTYWVLHADHGNGGGRQFVHQSYDLANQFFYESLADADGDGHADPDAGLGLNVLYQVKHVPLFRRHVDVERNDFVVCASQAYQVAFGALPRRSAWSRDWSAPNTYLDLTRYWVDPSLEPVDLPRRLLEMTAEENLYPGLVSDHPVRLLFFHISASEVLAVAREGSMGLIERRAIPGKERRFDYRYRVVERLEPDPEDTGGFRVQLAADPQADPLGYLAEPCLAERLSADPGWLGRWRDDREWLAATACASFPDAVVQMSHQLLDDPDQPRLDPNGRFDFVAVASPGWNFGAGAHQVGVDHGSLYRSSAQIPFLIRGPNLPRGVRVTRPARIIDILPTVLDLAAVPYDPAALDGVPVREIWAPAGSIRSPEAAAPVGFYVDQGQPVPVPDRTHEHPAIAHDFEFWWDAHNIALNLGAISSQEIVRLGDLVLDVVVPGAPLRPIESSLGAVGDAYHRLPDGKIKLRGAELVSGLRLHNITIGELMNPILSLQHIDRAASVVRWGQNVLGDLSSPLTSRGFDPLRPVDFVLDHTVGGVLTFRRSLVEGPGQLVHAAAEGVEAGVRSSAETLERRRWQTARKREETSTLPAEKPSRDVDGARLP